MIKLVVFDLDNTLAFHGEGIAPKTLAELRKIEDMGIKVAICSGKTAFYLAGFLRQVELENPIIIGENGAELQFGVNTPPEIYSIMQISAKKLKQLAWVKKKINKLFNNQIWFQNNRFAVSPFLNTTAEFEIVENFIIKHKRKLKGLNIYKHSDCYDFLPSEINKKTGLVKLLDIMKIKPYQIIAVGDGVNDYPMFELAGYSVGVNVADTSKVDVNFENISTALNHIINEKLKQTTKP